MNKKLYVGNLDYSIKSEDLEKLFSSEGKVSYSKVIVSPEGRSKGFGFVEMDTEEEATKAIEKYDKSILKDRTILVSEARPQLNRDPGGDSGRYKYDKKPKDGLSSKLKSIRSRKKF